MRLPIIIGILVIQIYSTATATATAAESAVVEASRVERLYSYLIKHYTLLIATYLSERN